MLTRKDKKNLHSQFQNSFQFFLNTPLALGLIHGYKCNVYGEFYIAPDRRINLKTVQDIPSDYRMEKICQHSQFMSL